MKKTVVMLGQCVASFLILLASHGNGLLTTFSIALFCGALLGWYDGDTLIYPFSTALLVLAFRGIIVTVINHWQDCITILRYGLSAFLCLFCCCLVRQFLSNYF